MICADCKKGGTVFISVIRNGKPTNVCKPCFRKPFAHPVKVKRKDDAE